jgi:hypothetical protein
MSATIIAFPNKQPLALRASGHTVDVLPVDRRGFVILDACVPLSVTIEFFNLLDCYQDKPVTRVRGGVPAYDRPAFDFEMVQPDPKGFVSIDACVPEQLAREFLAMVELSCAA